MKRMKTVRAWACVVDLSDEIDDFDYGFGDPPLSIHRSQAKAEVEKGRGGYVVEVEIKQVTPATRKRGRRRKR